jgi:glycine cleavage system regulatory protein
MSDIKLLKELLLVDNEGNKAKIIGVRGAESGIDHLEIAVQSKEDKEHGIKVVWSLTSTEVEA